MCERACVCRGGLSIQTSLFLPLVSRLSALSIVGYVPLRDGAVKHSMLLHADLQSWSHFTLFVFLVDYFNNLYLHPFKCLALFDLWIQYILFIYYLFSDLFICPLVCVLFHGTCFIYSLLPYQAKVNMLLWLFWH